MTKHRMLSVLILAACLPSGCALPKENASVTEQIVWASGEVSDPLTRKCDGLAFAEADGVTVVLEYGHGPLIEGRSSFLCLQAVGTVQIDESSLLWIKVPLLLGDEDGREAKEVQTVATGFLVGMYGYYGGYAHGYNVYPIDQKPVWVSTDSAGLHIRSTETWDLPWCCLVFNASALRQEPMSSRRLYWWGDRDDGEKYSDTPLRNADERRISLVARGLPWGTARDYFQALSRARCALEPVLETGYIALPHLSVTPP